MSLRCRPASTGSVSSDRQTYQENVRNTNTGLSVPLTSDESSIYNAAKAGSVDDRYSLTRSTDNPMDEILDGGMAANMAMFIPLAHEAHASHALYLSKKQMMKGPTWDSHPLSENCAAATARCDDKSELVLSDLSLLKKHSRDKSRYRKVASLNDLDDIQRVPKWPGRKGSPVRPAIPQFPPPYRSPTPPGLPSFGSPGAMSYSTQFFVHSFVREGHIQQRIPPTTGTLSNGGVLASYGATLRRLFGLSSPTPPPPTRQPIPVARAEDGTTVLGRFPYRHSAHGTSLVRRLDNHPFHRRALPAADCETVEEEAERSNQDGTRFVKPTSSAQVDASVRSPAGETHHFDSSSPIPAVPKPAVTPRCRNSAIAIITRQTSISQLQHGRTSLSGNEPQQQSSDPIGEPRRYLGVPETAQRPADPVLQFLQNRTLLCCCLPGIGEQDDIIYSQSSNDTYTTARCSSANGTICRG